MILVARKMILSASRSLVGIVAACAAVRLCAAQAEMPFDAAFRNPPPGYGEVPFWWWTGEKLDKDRLLWQIEELHRAGISGVQVNYSHLSVAGWKTAPSDPAIFSDEWWDCFSFAAVECAKRDMGIEVTIYNTLNNHYQTIPTRYKVPTVKAPSGLIGPVWLLSLTVI